MSDMMPAPCQPVRVKFNAFDYSKLSPEIAGRLQECAASFSTLHRTDVAQAEAIGRLMISAREGLKKRTFNSWIRTGLGWNTSAAYRRIRMVEVFDDALPKLGSLPVTVLDSLAREIVPEWKRAEIVRRAEAGGELQSKAIKAEIAAVVAAEKTRLAAAKEVERRVDPSPKGGVDDDALRSPSGEYTEARGGEGAEEQETQDGQSGRREVERSEIARGIVEALTPNRIAACVDRSGPIPDDIWPMVQAEAFRQRALGATNPEASKSPRAVIGVRPGFREKPVDFNEFGTLREKKREYIKPKSRRVIYPYENNPRTFGPRMPG